MEIQSFFLKHPEGTQLHYQKLGAGPKIILAFHGFGQDHSAYHILGKELEESHTVYSFDLFYHGHSYWHNNQEYLTKPFWKELILKFLQRHRIISYTLLGFSMGGRFALATLEAYPAKVDRILFIAPDGIKTSFWYSLATYPGALKNVFRGFIVYPERFARLVGLMHRIGLVDKGILKFANTQMKTTKQRRRVYYSWTVFKPLKFNMKRVAHLLNAYAIPTDMYLGRYDKIMTEKNMARLLQKLEDFELHVLEAGHNKLISETTLALKSRL